jgi:hypothetical protein
MTREDKRKMAELRALRHGGVGAGQEDAALVIVQIGKENGYRFESVKVEIYHQYGMVQIWKGGNHVATAPLARTLILWPTTNGGTEYVSD